MCETVRKHLSLKRGTVQKIKELESLLGLKSKGAESNIVDLAVEYFYEYTNNKTDFNEFSKKTLVLLNSLDKDMKMMFQFWNHYFYANDYEELATTKRVQTIPLMQAKEVVESEIRKARQRKLDREG